jgi:hypothetical protein
MLHCVESKASTGLMDGVAPAILPSVTLREVESYLNIDGNGLDSRSSRRRLSWPQNRLGRVPIGDVFLDR